MPVSPWKNGSSSIIPPSARFRSRLSQPNWSRPGSTPRNTSRGTSSACERQRNGKAVTLRQFVQSVANGEFEPCRLITSADLRAEVEQWWPIRLIREAAGAGDVEGRKRLLHYFLLELQVPLPDGVL